MELVCLHRVGGLFIPCLSNFKYRKCIENYTRMELFMSLAVASGE